MFFTRYGSMHRNRENEKKEGRPLALCALVVCHCLFTLVDPGCHLANFFWVGRVEI